MSKLTDSLIVAIDFSEDKDKTVLLVGRKNPNQTAKIVNAFQGQKAIDIWTSLIERSGSKS